MEADISSQAVGLASSADFSLINLFIRADIIVKTVIIILIACSIYSWAIIIEKVKFFNNLALTTTLPAQLAIKYNLDIVPVFIERINESKFNIEFYNPINPKYFENKIKLTEKLNNVLEEMIIRNPSQWIWTHDRWK